MKKRSSKLPQFAFFGVLVFATAIVAIGQTNQQEEETPPATASPSPAAATASPLPAPMPRVYEVDGELQLDSIVRVKVDLLKEWDQHNDKNDPIKLIPYINGRAIHGNYPEEVHGSYYNLHYHLEITPENKKVWTDLLGEPSGTRRPVTFSVGLENQTPFDTEFGPNNQKLLTVISPMYGVIALLLVLFTSLLFFWLTRKTNIIRETGASVPGKLRPYNLGRTQMAFWFFLIYASYLVIWLITGALDTITASLLGLMGISAGTALGEALIDSGKTDARSDQLQNLSAERQALEQSNAELQAQIANVNQTEAIPEDLANRDRLNKQLQDNRTRLAGIDQQTQTLTPTAAAGVSSGFLKDILSDGSGYSFHRFQIFAWTIVLGIMFLSSVYNNLTMPEFSATLLGLMGLSSGTYIGFKFPEQK